MYFISNNFLPAIVGLLEEEDDIQEEGMADELYANISFAVGAVRSASISSEARTPEEV